MVQAILDGRKTQTRRIISPQPPHWTWNRVRWDDRCINIGFDSLTDPYFVISPKGKPGDQLWVRETWASHPFNNKVKPSDLIQGSPIWYKANPYTKDTDYLWRPSIFMMRWMSRITLEIVKVRVERLQQITRDEARAEGCDPVWKWTKDRDPKYFKRGLLNPYVANFSVLWDSINTKPETGWDNNPWVWVIEFRKVKP